MSYQVSISTAAKRDIMNATDHIDFVLKNPDAADRLPDHIEGKYEVLSSFPQSFPVVDEPVLSFFGIRFIPVGKYLLLYTVFKESHQVGIVRFLYNRSNRKAIFSNELDDSYFTFEG